MNTTPLGKINLTVRLTSMSTEDMARLERVVIMLKRPNSVISELDVPAEGLDRTEKTASVVVRIEDGGVYKFSARLFFKGGTDVTTSGASSFLATDGLT